MRGRTRVVPAKTTTVSRAGDALRRGERAALSPRSRRRRAHHTATCSGRTPRDRPRQLVKRRVRDHRLELGREHVHRRALVLRHQVREPHLGIDCHGGATPRRPKTEPACRIRPRRNWHVRSLRRRGSEGAGPGWRGYGRGTRFRNGATLAGRIAAARFLGGDGRREVVQAEASGAPYPADGRGGTLLLHDCLQRIERGGVGLT